jgi:hypothetical protein
MFDPILGCRIDRRSFFGRVASAPQFQLELGLFLGQQFHNLGPLGSIRRFADELAISPNIFSADKAVHRSPLKAIGHLKRCAFLAGDASSMSGSGQVTRLRSTERASLITATASASEPARQLALEGRYGRSSPAASGRKTKKKTKKNACNREIRRREFFGGVIRVGLMTETGDRHHGQGSRQSHCPVSDMIDLHQCRLAVDAANLF